MTSRQQWTVLGAACVAVIVVPGLFFVRMRAGVQGRSVKSGSIHPVMSIPRARLGGIVREVLAKPGDRVEAGQVLVRFEAKDLEIRLRQLRQAAQAADAAVKGGDAMAQIPNQVRQYLYEMHPDTVKAEREYVDALAAAEQTADAGRERLRRAAEERMLVRRRLGKLFAGSANAGDSREYASEIARNIADVEKLLRESEVRAPSRAVVDLLEAHPGDRLQPGQPVAVLVSIGEYSVEFAVTEIERQRLHERMVLSGRLEADSRRIEGRIDSLSTRKLPVIARDNLQKAEEPLVRVRIVSAAPMRAGAKAEFEIP
jgi:multidrug efflux pump subunit AcrA (membrane-fusion protein)